MDESLSYSPLLSPQSTYIAFEGGSVKYFDLVINVDLLVFPPLWVQWLLHGAPSFRFPLQASLLRSSTVTNTNTDHHFHWPDQVLGNLRGGFRTWDIPYITFIDQVCPLDRGCPDLTTKWTWQPNPQGVFVPLHVLSAGSLLPAHEITTRRILHHQHQVSLNALLSESEDPVAVFTTSFFPCVAMFPMCMKRSTDDAA